MPLGLGIQGDDELHDRVSNINNGGCAFIAACGLDRLDAPLLTADDPFDGIRYDAAKIVFPSGPGLVSR